MLQWWLKVALTLYCLLFLRVADFPNSSASPFYFQMSVTLASIRTGCDLKEKMLKAKVIFSMDVVFEKKDPETKEVTKEEWLKTVVADKTGHFIMLVYLEKVFDKIREAVNSGHILKCKNLT